MRILSQMQIAKAFVKNIYCRYEIMWDRLSLEIPYGLELCLRCFSLTILFLINASGGMVKKKNNNRGGLSIWVALFQSMIDVGVVTIVGVGVGMIPGVKALTQSAFFCGGAGGCMHWKTEFWQQHSSYKVWLAINDQHATEGPMVSGHRQEKK